MKKRISFVVCSVIVVATIIAMLVFVLGSNEDTTSEMLDLEGTWKVVAYFSNGTASIINSEYMVFDAETVKDYRDNTTEPFVTSKYTLDSNLKLSLSDISRQYTVKKATENYISLYETVDTYVELIRYPNADMSPVTIDTVAFEGKWDIVFRKTSNIYAGSYMVFDDGIAYQYTGTSDAPVATSDYFWQNGNHLMVSEWSKEMEVYPIFDDVVIMVEVAADTGFIWEFKKDD